MLDTGHDNGSAAGLLTLSSAPVSATCLCCLHAAYQHPRMIFPAVLSQATRSCCCARSRTRSFGAGRMVAIRSSLPAPVAHVRGPRPSLDSSDNALLRVSSVPSTTLRPQQFSPPHDMLVILSARVAHEASVIHLLLSSDWWIACVPLPAGCICACLMDATTEPGSHHGAPSPPHLILFSVVCLCPALRREGDVFDCGRMACLHGSESPARGIFSRS